jgi:hypothetical protein
MFKTFNALCDFSTNLLRKRESLKVGSNSFKLLRAYEKSFAFYSVNKILKEIMMKKEAI